LFLVVQEDAHVAVMNLDGQPDRALFGVFDGHGGVEVARFCAQHLPELLLSAEAYKREDISAALVSAYLKIDEMLRDPTYAEELEELKTTSNEQSPGTRAGVVPKKGTLPGMRLHADNIASTGDDMTKKTGFRGQRH
jgi:hypothetical protein